MVRLQRFLRVVLAQEKNEGRHAEGGYLNAEPPMDGIAQEIPEGATVVQEGGKMYFQFDTIFFEQMTSNSGTSYKVVPPPGVSDVAT